MATNLGYVKARAKQKGTKSFRISQTGLSYVLSEEPEWNRMPPHTTIECRDSDTLFTTASAEGIEAQSISVSRDSIEAIKQLEPQFTSQLDQIISLLEEIKLQNQPKSLTYRLGTVISSIGISSISNAGGTALVALVRALASL